MINHWNGRVYINQVINFHKCYCFLFQIIILQVFFGVSNQDAACARIDIFLQFFSFFHFFQYEWKKHISSGAVFSTEISGFFRGCGRNCQPWPWVLWTTAIYLIKVNNMAVDDLVKQFKQATNSAKASAAFFVESLVVQSAMYYSSWLSVCKDLVWDSWGSNMLRAKPIPLSQTSLHKKFENQSICFHFSGGSDSCWSHRLWFAGEAERQVGGPGGISRDIWWQTHPAWSYGGETVLAVPWTGRHARWPQ